MAVQKSLKINKDLLVYKVFYFFYFGAIGTIVPYLPVYLRQIGLSALAVGLLIGIRPIIQLASAPFWTVLADKYRKRKFILVMSIIAWLIMTISLVFVEPTEEMCRLTARNSSHAVYANFTTLKTGFFKRSNERLWAIEASLNTNQQEMKTLHATSRDVTGAREMSDVVKRSTALGASYSSTPLGALRSRHRVVARQVRYAKNASNFSTVVSTGTSLGPMKANSSSLETSQFVVSQFEDQQQELSNASDTADHNLHKSVGKTEKSHQTAKIPVSDQKFTSVSENINGSMAKPQLITEERRPKATFDPYNMNGVSGVTSPQLSAFFMKSQQNTTTAEPKSQEGNTKYYNMNGVDNKLQNPVETKVNLSIANETQHGNKPSETVPQKEKHSKSTNHTHKKRYTNKVNATLTIMQKNLFKTNSNEMKRLFVILLVLIVVGEFLETPSAPLSDASLLDYLGEGRIHYGKQRLWGSLGHGVFSFLVGSLLEKSRHLTCGEEFIDYSICFCVFTLLMLASMFPITNFKFQYRDMEKQSSSVFSTVLSVHYISFLIGVCYLGMCHGVLHNFLTWFLEDIGASKTLMGLVIGSRNCADIITFLVASLLIEHLGQIKIVFIALVSYGMIFVAYSSMSNPWYSLVVEFLQGFTYAASWSACASYLAEAAPEESVATMQGLLQGVYWGLGTGTGTILAGHFIHTLGPHVTFRLAAVGSFFVALLFAITQWRWPRHDLDESLEIYDYFSTGGPKDTEALLRYDTDNDKHDKRGK